MQWTWYGAGFIDFMFRGPNGKYITVHRLRNNNVNNEAWMRTGNMPVRYEVQTEGGKTTIVGDQTIGITDTVIPVADGTLIPASGQVYIDNEIISYTGEHEATITGTVHSVATSNAASISGNTLSLSGTITGTWAIGMLVTGTNVVGNCFITAGSGLSWTVSSNQSVSSTNLTGTLDVVTITNTTLMAVGHPIVPINNTAFPLASSVLGGINSGKTYWILNIPSSTQLTLAAVSTISSSTPQVTVSTVVASPAQLLTVASIVGCTRGASTTQWSSGGYRTFTAGAAATHQPLTGVLHCAPTCSPIVSHWGAAFLQDGGFDSDRGYIFSYQSPNVNISTKKTTAFAIRLAPSVSNALTGDLGTRDLLNRAQFLLQGIEITAGGTSNTNSALVIEGILNPSNYPTPVNNISYNSLSSAVIPTGQPSFSQVAAGTSITFDGSATNQPFVSLAASLGANAIFVSSILGVQVTDDVFFPAVTNAVLGQTKISSIVNTSNAVFTATISATALTISLLVSGTVIIGMGVFGVGVAPNTYIVSGSGNNWNINQSNTIGSATNMTASMYSITLNQPLQAAITLNSVVSFSRNTYASPGETVFSFINSPSSKDGLDLSALKELTSTPLGGRGTFPNGPDVLMINVYLTQGNPVLSNLVLRWGEAQA
jgi:hypothetical protein